MLKIDLLRLRDAESAADVGEWFLGEDDCAGSHRADLADKLDVFDCFREELQAAAILFEKPEPWTIDLRIDQQANKTFVTETGCESKFALRDVEGRLGVAQKSIMQASHVLERRVAHRGVVTIDV